MANRLREKHCAHTTSEEQLTIQSYSKPVIATGPYGSNLHVTDLPESLDRSVFDYSFSHLHLGGLDVASSRHEF